MTPTVSAGQAFASSDTYAQLLAVVVKPDGKGYNRVDYAKLAGVRGELDGIVAVFESQSPSAMGRDEAKAFWINLYNAATLQVVAKHYPVKSIRDIKLGGTGLFGSGPWKQKLVKVEGQSQSLDDIETGLRKKYNDPFIHYALNCASKSCPNLAVRPYQANSLDAQMRDNARDYVNHPRGLKVKDGAITASKIYTWYVDDFGGKAKLKPHWMALADAEKAGLIETAKLTGYEYDWSLNNV